MNTENKIKIRICGIEYSLTTDNEPKYAARIAARLDKEMSEIIRDNPGFGIQNAAVVTALNALDESRRSEESIDDLRGQIQNYVSEATSAHSSKEKLTAQVRELESRIDKDDKENKERLEKIGSLEKENKELAEKADRLEKENKELSEKANRLEKELAEVKKSVPAFGCEQLVLENTIPSAITIDSEDTNKDEPEPTPDKSADSEKLPDNKSYDKHKKSAAGNSSGSSASSHNEKDQRKVPSGSIYDRAYGKKGEGTAEAAHDGNSSQDDNIAAVGS